MRLAASRMERCLVTDWRAMSRSVHNSDSVWPSRLFSRSRRRRRLGSARARKPASNRLAPLCWCGVAHEIQHAAMLEECLGAGEQIAEAAGRVDRLLGDLLWGSAESTVGHCDERAVRGQR